MLDWYSCSGIDNSSHGHKACGKRLFKYSPNLTGQVEMKCPRCGAINHLNRFPDNTGKECDTCRREA